MRRIVILLALVASAGPAEAQVLLTRVFPECLDAHSVRLLAPGIATPNGPDAQTTDGFGVRLGPEAERTFRRTRPSILTDADLAWRTPSLGPRAASVCPGLMPTGLDPMGGEREIRVAAEVGNETGDPGPLRYLDPGLPNVDKIGPDYEATLRFPGRAVVSARWRDFLPTDPAIAPRIFDALESHFPKRKGLALGASAHPTDRVRVVAEALVAEDLPFEESLGREMPVLRRRLGARLDGDGEWRSRGWPRWSWRAHLSPRVEWLERPSWSTLGVGGGLGPDWREAITEVGGEVRERVSGAETGVTVRHRSASGPGLATGEAFLWAEATARLRSCWILPGGTVSGAVSAGPSGVGGGGSVGMETARAPDRPFVLSAEVEAHRELPEATPDLVFWTSRGYSGLASPATPLSLTNAPQPLDRATIRARGDGSNGAVRLELSATTEARRGESVYLPTFTLAEDAVAVSGSVRAVSASGAVSSVRAAISTGVPRPRGASPAWHVRFGAWTRARIVLAGDDAFRAARDREPSVRVGAHAEHSPDGRLKLGARLEWRSATRWDGWPEPHLPAALLADLGLDYTLGPFTLALTGRNVLGAREQTHPLGATLGGRLFVRLEARF